MRSTNECVALTAFNLSAALNSPENGGHELSTSLIQMDNLIDWFLKHNLSIDSYMVQSSAVNWRNGPFYKMENLQITNVGISFQNFLSFNFNPFSTMV